MAQSQTQQNLQIIDRQLDALVDITGQQKVISGQINTELKDQNQMISSTTQKMDNVDQNVQKATSQVHKVGETTSSCISWILMILLIIAIILVWTLF